MAFRPIFWEGYVLPVSPTNTGLPAVSYFQRFDGLGIPDARDSFVRQFTQCVEAIFVASVSVNADSGARCGELLQNIVKRI